MSNTHLGPSDGENVTKCPTTHLGPSDGETVTKCPTTHLCHSDGENVTIVQSLKQECTLSHFGGRGKTLVSGDAHEELLGD